MPVTLEQSETLNEIRLEGAIDINCAAELKAHLLDALKSGDTVRVSLEKMRDMDVTAYQLLWAAVRASKQLGVELSFTGLVPEEISNTLSQVGFDRLPLTVNAK